MASRLLGILSIVARNAKLSRSTSMYGLKGNSLSASVKSNKSNNNVRYFSEIALSLKTAKTLKNVTHFLSFESNWKLHVIYGDPPNLYWHYFIAYLSVDLMSFTRGYSSCFPEIATYEEIKGLPYRPDTLLIDVRETSELMETGAVPTSINIPRKFVYIC